MQPRFKAPIKGATATAPHPPSPALSSSIASCKLAVEESSQCNGWQTFFPPFNMWRDAFIRSSFFCCCVLFFWYTTPCPVRVHVLFLVISIFACVLRPKNLPEMRQTQLWELPRKMPLLSLRKAHNGNVSYTTKQMKGLFQIWKERFKNLNCTLKSLKIVKIFMNYNL